MPLPRASPFLLLAALAACAARPAPAQMVPGPEGVLEIGDDLSRFLLRQQVLGRLRGAHLSAQPLSAYEARRHLDSLALRREGMTPADRYLLARHRREVQGPGVAWVRQWVPGLYRDGEAFISVASDDYTLHLEPLAYLSYGRARRSAAEGEDPWVSVWQNTRGARAAGHLGDHLFFEGRLEENQVRVPFSQRDPQSHTAPRLPLVRDLDGAYDYMLSTGIVGVRTKYVELRFGRDRNRWGFGRGSAALSDYAPVYDQLQIRTQFWRLHYTNLFAMFVDRPLGPWRGDRLLPRKYGAYHRLALDLGRGVEVEVFEAVAFADDITAGGRSGFDVAYLNPIILYRAVEGDIGSPDNMMVGAGAAWQPTPGLRLHGQLVLDEFKASEIRNDWWANKWGYVLGAEAADPGGLPNLDLGVEYARLRPFLYSHRSLATAFVHQGDVLGHPAGPNASDLSAWARYRPTPRVTAALDVAYTRRGRNPDGQNFGADPRLPYTTRPPDRDQATTTLQGVRQDYLLVEARAGYELLPGLYAEGVLRAESVDDAQAGLRRYVAPFASLRWGLPFQSVRY
jgi:hypothetical protein